MQLAQSQIEELRSVVNKKQEENIQLTLKIKETVEAADIKGKEYEEKARQLAQ